MKNSLLLLLMLTFFGCKETCYSCVTMCTKFEGTSLTYCLFDFQSEEKYIEAVDSVKNYLIVEDVFRQVSSFCDSEKDISLYTNSFGWTCQEQ